MSSSDSESQRLDNEPHALPRPAKNPRAVKKKTAAKKKTAKKSAGKKKVAKKVTGKTRIAQSATDTKSARKEEAKEAAIPPQEESRPAQEQAAAAAADSPPESKTDEAREAGTPQPIATPDPRAEDTPARMEPASTPEPSQPEEHPPAHREQSPPSSETDETHPPDQEYRGRRDRRDRNRRGRNRRHRGHGDEGDDVNGSGDNRPRKEVELGPPMDGSGMVELSPKGFGFLRQPSRNFYQTNKDTFIPPDMVREFSLRDGLMLTGEVRRGPRGPQLTAIKAINGGDPARYRNLPVFEELTAINPNKRWILETDPKRHTTRIIDMMAPVGKGQRGLIVAPPRTGKTTLIEHIAQAVIENYPQAKIILLLVDERPEEVTELTRALPKAEIMASSNDNDTRTHMRVAQLTIERAKRLVEAGEDVFILLDSITRLARAFNRAMKGKGGINKGGLSNRALEIPRRLFAAARNTREAGSLTILATALIETGTMMDEAIFQEFKGTGNMELVLDKKIAQHYVYPAVDIFKSGTRREELLLPPHQIEKIYVIRRGLSGHKPIEAIERLLSFVERFPNNAQMLVEIKSPSVE